MTFDPEVPPDLRSGAMNCGVYRRPGAEQSRVTVAVLTDIFLLSL